MLPVLSERVSSFFVRSKIIRQEDKEVYSYSFEVLFATVMNFAVLYLIALFTGRIWETTLFIAGFIPLRALAGGYHAKTHFRCLLALLLNYAGFLGIIYLITPEWYAFINIGCAVVSVAVICLLSPVEDKNKPLTETEKKYFKHRSQVAILIYAVVIVAGTIIFQSRIEFLCVSVGALSVSLSLVTMYFKSKIKHNV